MLYINNIAYEWQTICETGRIVKKKDEIIWKFEYPPQIIEEYNEKQKSDKKIGQNKFSSFFTIGASNNVGNPDDFTGGGRQRSRSLDRNEKRPARGSMII